VESTPEAARLYRILSTEKVTGWSCLKLPDGTYTKLVEETEPSYGKSLPGIRRYFHEKASTMFRAFKAWDPAAKVIQPVGVEWAIKTFKPYKAPNPDGIYPILLQQGLNELLGPLTKAFRASIALRHVPKT